MPKIFSNILDTALLIIATLIMAGIIIWLVFVKNLQPSDVEAGHETQEIPARKDIGENAIEHIKPVLQKDNSASQSHPFTSDTIGKIDDERIIPPETQPTRPQSDKQAIQQKAPVITNLKNGWKRYTGNWFKIDFPDDYDPESSLKLNSGCESAFFKSSDSENKFYIAVCNKKTIPSDIAYNPASENELEKSENKNSTWFKCEAKDRSYIRVFRATYTSSGTWVIGYSFRSWAVYELNKENYLKFKSSFRRLPR